MSINVQRRELKHQLRVKHKLLHRPFFFTFDSDTEAWSYGRQLQALLDRGVVPAELLTAAPRGENPLLIEMIRAYIKGAPVTASDEALLGWMLEELAGVRLADATFAWVDGYVRKLKLERNLSPSTIRKRIGAMARVTDWHLRRVTPPDQVPPVNPFRLLPVGYSNYSRAEAAELEERNAAAAKAGQEVKPLVAKQDQERDLRLTPEQDGDVRAALAGVKRPDRERALEVDPEFTLLYKLILDTGLRLREAYRLRVDQVDLARRLIDVEGTKGHRGKLKPRQVPLKAELHAELTAWLKGRIGRVFPTLWDGSNDPKDLARTTSRLSVRFGTLFRYAGVDGFTEHDLRHEATCRWVLLRNKAGGWVFGDIEICRIMGWADPKMMLRYASLRGEDLAARLAL